MRRPVLALLLALLPATAAASSLDVELVRTALRRANPALQVCLEREPTGLEGRALFRLEVAADGRITEATVTFPIEAQRFTSCLVDAIRQVRLPKGPAPITLHWPVVFRAAPPQPPLAAPATGVGGG